MRSAQTALNKRDDNDNDCVVLKLCFWNMNGIKNKFMSTDVLLLLNSIDILIIGETHFNIRTKCPDGYFLVGRSKASGLKKPRGGIAVYINTNTNLKLNVLNDEFTDMVVFEIENTNIAIIAVYIQPNN